MPGALDDTDDLRHLPPDGGKGRDSLYFNLLLPERRGGVFVYTWVDHASAAGRLVTTWTPDGEPHVFDIAHGVEVGSPGFRPGSDFDDWEVAGLRLTHPRAAADRRADLSQRRGGDRVPVRGHARGVRLHPQPGGLSPLDGGQPLRAVGPGYVLRDGEPVALVRADCRATYRDDMTSDALHATLHDERGGVTELVLERYATIELPVGRSTELHEAARRAWIDGVAGSGQFETQWPAAYIAALREADA